MMREYPKWRDFLMEQLAERKAAIDYLQVSLEAYQVDGDTFFFLKEIQTMIEAQGGVEELAKRTGMDPQTLSSEKALHLDTFAALLKALGCRLSIEPLKTEDCGAAHVGVDASVAPIKSTKSDIALATHHK